MDWSPEQLKIIEFFKGPLTPSMLVEKMWKSDSSWKDKVPPRLKRWKCFDCKAIIGASNIEEPGVCPECKGTFLVEMCPLDHAQCSCNQGKPIIGIEYCPICGDPICPRCATHDVTQISRVTGYLQDVNGFNEGKKQELKDRKRVTTEEIK